MKSGKKIQKLKKTLNKRQRNYKRGKKEPNRNFGTKEYNER